MAQLLVSIIITNYNYDKFLKSAIDSALNQIYLKTEVVVVDDGSTDNSRDIIKSYGDQIVPVLKANGGQASAFNAGFAASRGDIICFLDSDDMFMPEKVAEIVEVFSLDQELGWCYHPLQLKDANTGTLIKSSYTCSSGKCDLRELMKTGNITGKLPCCPATSGLCFRRSLLQQILPMPEAASISLSDNYIKFTAVALSKGFTLAKELALQNIHSDNAFSFRKDKSQLTARIHILTAYWIREKFPSIKKFANNIFAVGLGTYWRSGGIEATSQEVIKSYLSSLFPLEKLEINFRAFYHRLKL